MDVWAQVFNSDVRGFDAPEPWLSRPGVPPAEFARQLLRSIAETAGWAAADDCDLDDAEDRDRLLSALASIEECLMTLRVGIAEAMTREAK